MAHQEQDPKNLLIVTVGLGSVVTLAGVMFGLYSYYQNLRDEWQHIRVGERPNPELISMRAEGSRQLTSYAYTDKSRKSVRIPVDQAMTLLAQRGRDAFPSIQPAMAASAALAAPGGSAMPASSGSAAPGGSAAPPGSAAPGGSATPGDKKEHH